jgi:ssDNA-binding Zn-finger/Zn-ribbon topoisomerase 1
MFCDSLLDNWLSSLSDTEYATYWKINKLIHLNTDDGTAEFTWDSFTGLIGKPNQNLKVLRLLDKFHRDERIIWLNREEFIRQNVPQEIREKIGIEVSSEDSCGDSIRYRPWHWLKGGKIVGKIACFSPKLLKYYDSSVYRKKRENNRDIDKREKTENTPSVLQQNLSKSHCPECQAPLTVKPGPYGDFVSCSRFPNCQYKRSIKDDDWREGHSRDLSTVRIQQSEEDEPLTREEQEKAKLAREKCMKTVNKLARNLGNL